MPYPGIDPEVAKELMKSQYEPQRKDTHNELKEIIIPLALMAAGVYGGYRGLKYVNKLAPAVSPAVTSKLPANVTPKMLKELRNISKGTVTLKEVASQGGREADRDLLYQLYSRVKDMGVL